MLMMQNVHISVIVFYTYFSATVSRCYGLTDQEIQALNAINKKWNVAEWKGSPNCSWPYLTCRDNKLVQIIFKNLDRTKICGGIPCEICQLTNVEELTISEQLLSGLIPDCLDNLQNLTHIHMPGNCFNGTIPHTLGELKNLKHLDLSGNTHHSKKQEEFLCSGSGAQQCTGPGLTGQIPPELFHLPKIEHIALSYNDLTSTIPDSVGNATRLHYLTIDANRLEGKIPQNITKLRLLETLRLNGNLLTGSIPDASGGPNAVYWPDLYLLDLRNNNLTGSLPENLKLTDLHILLLSGNKHMSDMSPTRIGFPNYVHVDTSKRSVINLTKHYECPAFILEKEQGSPRRSSIVELDPEYYYYSLCFCSNNYYGVAPNSCQPCPSNGNCSVIEFDTIISSTKTTVETMPLPKGVMSFKAGLYPVPMDRHYEAKYVKGLEPCIWVHDGFSPCNPNGNCGYLDGILVGLGNNATNVQWCTLCFEGYTDRLCSKCECKSGKASSCYYHSHKRCTKCTSAPSWQVAALVIISIIVIVSYGWFSENTLVRLLLLIIAVAFLLACEASSWFYYEMLFISIILLPATSNGLSSGLVKSLIFFLQTLSTIAPNILPLTILNVIGHLQFINLQPVGLVCLFPQTLGASRYGAVYEFIIHLCAPYIIFFAQCAVLSIKAVINKCRGCHCVIKNGTTIKCQKCKSKIRHEIYFSYIFITYFAFFNAATGIASVFNCHEDVAMDSYLVTRPYIQCGSYEQKLMQGIGLVCGIFFLLMPIIVFTALLYLNRQKLWNENDDIKKWLGYLYLSYRPAPKWLTPEQQIVDENVGHQHYSTLDDGQYKDNPDRARAEYQSIEDDTDMDNNNDLTETNTPGNIQIYHAPGEQANAVVQNQLDSVRKPSWYHNYLYFSEILFMILRLLLAISLNVFNDEQLIWKNIGVLGVLILIIIVFVVLKPYKISTENVMGCVSVFILMFNFFGSTQIDAMKKYSYTIRLSVQWFFFLINFIIVAIFVTVILKHGRKNIIANVKRAQQLVGNCLGCIRRQNNQQIVTPLIK